MYKFHLINTKKKRPAKLGAIKFQVWKEIHFYRDNILVFIICLKQMFLGTI